METFQKVKEMDLEYSFLKMDQYLDFEQPIYTRLEKIEELKKAVPPPKNLSKELNGLEVEAEKES